MLNKEKPKKILIIEDDPTLVKAYEIKFAKENIKVDLVTNGHEALKFLKNSPPDLVLLDLLLPGIDGFSILENIRNNKKWAKVPVIILSNLGQSQDLDKGRDLGVIDYVIKSNFKINDIVKKVKDFLSV